MKPQSIKAEVNSILDQSTIFANAETLEAVMDWMEAPATEAETAGMRRLVQARPVWSMLPVETPSLALDLMKIQKA